MGVFTDEMIEQAFDEPISVICTVRRQDSDEIIGRIELDGTHRTIVPAFTAWWQAMQKGRY